MIPAFRDDGNLPNGLHVATEAEVTFRMISTMAEYEKAELELHDLEERLQQLQESTPVGAKGFTKAGIRKLIARLHEELALFEGSEEARAAKSP